MGLERQQLAPPEDLDCERRPDRMTAEHPKQIIKGDNRLIADLHEQVARPQSRPGRGGIRVHLGDPHRCRRLDVVGEGKPPIQGHGLSRKP